MVVTVRQPLQGVLEKRGKKGCLLPSSLIGGPNPGAHSTDEETEVQRQSRPTPICRGVLMLREWIGASSREGGALYSKQRAQRGQSGCDPAY